MTDLEFCLKRKVKVEQSYNRFTGFSRRWVTFDSRAKAMHFKEGMAVLVGINPIYWHRSLSEHRVEW